MAWCDSQEDEQPIKVEKDSFGLSASAHQKAVQPTATITGYQTDAECPGTPASDCAIIQSKAKDACHTGLWTNRSRP